jgi:hypothetical protein
MNTNNMNLKLEGAFSKASVAGIAIFLVRVTSGLIRALPVLAGAGTALGQPTITDEPQDQTNYTGTTATLTVMAKGTDPLSYQWEKASPDFVALADHTNSSLELCNVQTNDTGDYRVVVTDTTGSTNSAVTHLSVVLPETLFISQPAPGLVTLSWKGPMVLLELYLGTVADRPCWFQVAKTSPVTLPSGSGERFFTLWSRNPDIFQRDLDRCHQGEMNACEDCIKDYFMLNPGPWSPSADCETAASIGSELGSTRLPEELDWFIALRSGIQPPFFGNP